MPPKKHIRSPQPGNVGERIKPRESGSGSSDVLAPIFCLRHVAHGWGVDACEREDQAAFALTLQRLARLTWQQIRTAPRHGVGTEKIARTALRAGVPATITDDVDFLVQVLADVADPEVMGQRVEAVAPGVAQAGRPDLGADVGAPDEGIVGGDRVRLAVRRVVDVYAEHLAAEER